ncbi:MAG TPA: hypothetical protein VEI73_17340 [Candidatus Acidoferrum sp.]|nr:hypothetical protein [Candidatus Acidoferrum sp.]
MKKLTYFCLLGALSLSAQPLVAQDKGQEKPKTEERAKPEIPIKVQLVFSEYDGDKKLSSMPYTFGVIANERGLDGTSVRTGVRIPIEVNDKDSKTIYMDVGSNIDCRIRIGDEGRYAVSLTFDRSALYPNKSPEGERLVTEPNGQPLVRQFRTNENLLLKDGQTTEAVVSTDPLNGHTLRVSVTINVQK